MFQGYSHLVEVAQRIINCYKFPVDKSYVYCHLLRNLHKDGQY